MKYFWLTLFLIAFYLSPSGKVYSQNADTVQTTTAPVKKKKDPAPRRAAIRSAILPGWGQAYNKKYWKIPILYAGAGVLTGFLIHNNREFLIAKKNVEDSIRSGGQRAVRNIDRINRDQFRQWRDWNIVFLIGLYALNIVDANVDAHLKEFDVGENLSFTIKPYLYAHHITYKPLGGLAFNFKLKK